MPCYSPLSGWRAKYVNPETGKRSVTFNRKDAYTDLPVEVPCGQCIGCRLDRSRQWAVRCVHEASLHENNCFITLTYDDDHLPHDGGLHVDHWQKFMKRLRKRYGKIRFFHCGEYGEKTFRPHYHACLFGFDFPDKELWSERDGVRLYISKSLAELWPFGFSTIGDVTFDSAAYVARYVMKKVTGDRAEQHYQTCDPETGEIHQVRPEYTTMSRRPGIGAGWFQKYYSDAYPSDFVVVEGRKITPPKFYDGRYELINPEKLQEVKKERRAKAKTRKEDHTRERLKVAETVKKAQLKQLPRNVE